MTKVTTPAIAIVKGTDSIVALIGSIGTKQTNYRNSVSSAVISAVAHSLENNETSTVTKLLNEMFTVSYRDLKVVRAFIESVTPIKLEEVKEGNKTRLAVTAVQFMKSDYSKEGTQKEQREAAAKALTAHNKRADLFETFCDVDGEMRVRNLDWKEGDAKDTKTIGVKYKSDVFAWFEDVEYVRKAVKKEKDAETDGLKLCPKDVNEIGVDKLASLATELEKVPAADRSTEFKTHLANVQAAFDFFTTQAKANVEKRAAMVEAALLKKAGATEEQIEAWKGQKAKRVTEGKDAENIAKEFDQYVESLKKAA